MATFKRLEDIVVCEDAYSEEEIVRLRSIMETIDHTGYVDRSTGDRVSRKNWWTHLERSSESRPIYEKVDRLAREINERFFHFDLDRIVRHGISFIKYDLPTDFYDWHTDKTDYGAKENDVAKLGVILQLSDPSEYEGGVVEVVSDGIARIERKRGLLYSIPAFTPHRVTPVTSGIRRAMAAWFTGPPFR